MTLVIARRRDDVAWIIADTYAEIPALNAKVHPFELPTPKVARVREFAVAYAGSVDAALSALSDALRGTDAGVIESLLEHHRRNLNSPSAVDFVALNTTTFDLIRIQGGSAESVERAFLGSPLAASAYQKNRHQPPSTDSTTFGLNMLNIPSDQVSKESNDEFSESFGAFHRTLQDSNVECGGFAVPFYASKQWTGHPFYTSASRGPIQPEETTHFGNTSNVWDDEIGGGFTFNFWGGPESFAVYFEKRQLGHFYFGVERSSLACETVRPIDPFDFSERAEANGMGGAIAKDWLGALQKAVSSIEHDDLLRARKYLDFVQVQIENHLKAQNNERAFSLSEGVVAAMLSAGEVTFTVIIANMITDYLAVNEAFYAATNDQNMTQKMLKERRSWREVIETGKIRLRFEEQAKPAS